MAQPIKVSTPERQRILRLLSELAKGNDVNCRWCGHSILIMADELAELPAFLGPALYLGGKQSFPCVIVVCARCGYVHPFHAETLGIKVEEFDLSVKKNQEQESGDANPGA